MGHENAMQANAGAADQIVDRLRLVDLDHPRAVARSAGHWLAGSAGAQLAIVALTLVTVAAVWWELRQRRAVRAQERETGTDWFWDGIDEDAVEARLAGTGVHAHQPTTDADTGVTATTPVRRHRTPALTG
jgi:hypothetical protein